tara:strand:- start:18 stop:200 length:183 start_codon:yes stop_codon:yes gene_type:complete
MGSLTKSILYKHLESLDKSCDEFLMSRTKYEGKGCSQNDMDVIVIAIMDRFEKDESSTNS